MGTSASSSGSPSGVALIPPWAEGTPGNEDNAPPAGIAPPARFMGARTRLGRFSREGSRDDLRAGLAHYVRGTGGSSTAARRLGRTSAAAGAITATLSALARGETYETPSGQVLDPASLAGLPARQITAELAQAIAPITGDQDAEASRVSIDEALSQLLETHPDADLTALTEQQIQDVTANYIAEDIYTHISLDIGKAIQSNAPTVAIAAQRFDEIRDYVREVVAEALTPLSSHLTKRTASEISTLAKDVIEETCRVFEGYA